MKVHDVIQRPLVTEKSNIGREEENLVTLAVDPRATKHDVKRAVEALFSVSVVDVRTMRGQIRRAQARVEEGDRASGRGPDDRVLRGDLTEPWAPGTTDPRLPVGAA